MIARRAVREISRALSLLTIAIHAPPGVALDVPWRLVVPQAELGEMMLRIERVDVALDPARFLREASADWDPRMRRFARDRDGEWTVSRPRGSGFEIIAARSPGPNRTVATRSQIAWVRQSGSPPPTRCGRASGSADPAPVSIMMHDGPGRTETKVWIEPGTVGAVFEHLLAACARAGLRLSGQFAAPPTARSRLRGSAAWTMSDGNTNVVFTALAHGAEVAVVMYWQER